MLSCLVTIHENLWDTGLATKDREKLSPLEFECKRNLNGETLGSGINGLVVVASTKGRSQVKYFANRGL